MTTDCSVAKIGLYFVAAAKDGGLYRSSGTATPFPFLVSHPGSRLLQFGLLVVSIHLEHRHPALAGLRQLTGGLAASRVSCLCASTMISLSRALSERQPTLREWIPLIEAQRAHLPRSAGDERRRAGTARHRTIPRDQPLGAPARRGPARRV
jgi:hypothetical protein